MNEKGKSLINDLDHRIKLKESEKELVKKLSSINPSLAEYYGTLKKMEKNPIKTFFKLKENISSKEEFKQKFILENIISENDDIIIGETLELIGYGKFYFLSDKDDYSKIVIYFTNPGQEEYYKDYLEEFKIVN